MTAVEASLEELSQEFPTPEAARAEVAALRTKLTQPAGAELFVSDLHGEADAFLHILRNDCAPETQVHVVGDVYDRGPKPEAIMDALAELPALDFQWGNHDIVWMGAALGQRGCIAHVVRNCARYGNLSILEDAYGMDLEPLAEFAKAAYADDPCAAFGLKGHPEGLSPEELELNVKIQKAMAIMQFKAEGQLIDQNPSFGLDDRKLLDKIDYERGTVLLDGEEYALTDTVFPTVDPADPYRLTSGEEEALQSLEQAFTGCEKLQRHMAFLLEVGSLYAIANGNLLFHACVPLNADGSLMEVDVFGETYKGRALYDALDRCVRDAFESPDAEARRRGRDLLWWMWLGQGSPLFAKSKMATFELYLIAEKPARKEVKNPFYSFMDDERVMGGVLADFGLDIVTSHIVCGHVPVKVKDGENPVKCGGRVLCIDGGFSSAYQPTTGIAGFTLENDAESMVLTSRKSLATAAAETDGALDTRLDAQVIERYDPTRCVADTDEGAGIGRRIAALERLLEERA